jgi:nucleosome binding factor SPN SPT16 subunit
MTDSVDNQQCSAKVNKLQSLWRDNAWDSAVILIYILGKSENGVNYSKEASLFIYLLGRELPETAFILTASSVVFIGSVTHCSFVKLFMSDVVNLSIIELNSWETNNNLCDTALSNIIKNTTKCGVLLKSRQTGRFIDSWKQLCSEKSLESFDISKIMGLFFATKDNKELSYCQKASTLSCKVLRKEFVTSMEKIFENDISESHVSISNRLETTILQPSLIDVLVDENFVEVCYSPIVQSGGCYDTKVTAQSTDQLLSADVVLCSIGARYKGYCANVSRTFLVNPPDSVVSSYCFLLDLFDHCLQKMIVGNSVSDVWNGGREYVMKNKPSFLSNLPLSIGSIIGMEFRDSTCVINKTNSTLISPGMVFNLSISLNDVSLSLEDQLCASVEFQKLGKYSLLLADVVSVQQDGKPIMLTKYPSNLSEINYKQQPKSNVFNGNASFISRQSRRQLQGVSGKQRDIRTSLQAEILAQNCEQQLKMFVTKSSRHDCVDETKSIAIDLHTYKSSNEFPQNLSTSRVAIDLSREAVLVPINNRLVPFHISTIKSISTPNPDMRISFHIPCVKPDQSISSNMRNLIVKHGTRVAFIKELTFQPATNTDFSDIYKQYQELSRVFKKRNKAEEQMRELITQPNLIISHEKCSKIDIIMRPTINKSNKHGGKLTAYSNGFRYTSVKHDDVDVIYTNIKHSIFQPCIQTNIVLIHFSLHQHQVIGGKKCLDIQFYNDVTESSISLLCKQQTTAYSDELDSEQEDRIARNNMNKSYKDFCVQMTTVSSNCINFEIPFKKSGFMGCWGRQMIEFIPTRESLVSLTEWPPFLLLLSEIEHVHLERVSYATRAFDIVFITTNHSAQPITITAVELKHIDKIQDWLNLMKISCTKGPQSLNWIELLKTIRHNMLEFYSPLDSDGFPKPAGWAFLSECSNSENSCDEDEDSSVVCSTESSSDSETGSDYATEDSSEDGMEMEDKSDERGMSWEELELMAYKEDQRHDKHNTSKTAREASSTI